MMFCIWKYLPYKQIYCQRPKLVLPFINYVKSGDKTSFKFKYSPSVKAFRMLPNLYLNHQ